MADWLSDTDLEEVYRKGSENHDFQYSEAAWNDMERLLDKRKKRRLFFFVLSFILLGGVTYMMSSYFSSSSDLNKRQILTETTNGADGKTTDRVIENTDIVAPVTSILESDLNSESLTSNNNNLSTTLNNTKVIKSNDKARSSRNTSLANNKQSTVRASNIRNVSGSERQIIGSTTLTTKNGLSNSLTNNLSSRSEDVIESVIEHSLDNSTELASAKLASELSFGLIPLGGRSFSAFPVLLDWSGQIPELAALNATEEKIATNTFIVGLTLGTETTWTPTGEFSSIDYNIGLRTSFYLGNKLGINVGASYLTDVFEAPGMDYKSSQDFWKVSGAPGAPITTQAKSSMIELSTGISYAFNGVHNKGVTVGANVISNFMIKEDYEYLYPNENDNFNSSWIMANNTWLNAVDLNASYRFKLGDDWLLESGPYFKVPLNGIGHGNMKLSTFGIRVSVGFTK